ncbi:MAG: exodeoxyribonuclease V subunit gamma, partial [Acidimicrobiales bacterium]
MGSAVRPTGDAGDAEPGPGGADLGGASPVVGPVDGSRAPEPGTAPRPTLLQRLQADLRANREPGQGNPAGGGTGGGRPLLDPGDRSLQVHACHGRARQVEVLRDAILHLLEHDPTREPRHIEVMGPDIEAFAPLIQATFGTGSQAGGQGVGDRDLHVRLADRSIRQTNPVLGAVADLLTLASGRFTASDLVDLAGRPPVRQRFGWDDDDLARIADWAREAGARWGIDAASRAPFGLDKLEAGTWKSALDRLLLGVAMSEDGLPVVGGVLPLDDVDSSDVVLAGHLAELVDRLAEVTARFAVDQPVGEWVAAIRDAAGALFAAGSGEEWQGAQLRSLLDDVLDESAVSNGSSPVAVSLAEVRA